MKFIGFWEYDKKDEAALFEKFKTRPETLVTRLFPPYCIVGQTKGFSLMEGEDVEKMEQFMHHYKPLLKFKIFPIIELEKLLEVRKY
jgi:hypothetical protein